MNDHHDQTRLEVVCDEQGFLALEREWNALWLKANGRYFQRFDICLLAWRHVAAAQGRKLHCIVLRENGELRLVWPLVSWRRFLWTYLLPLSPDAADYTSVLVEDGPRAAGMIEAAWRLACAKCKADFVHLPYVNEGSELHRIALRERHVLGRSRHESWVAQLRDETDWATYCRSLGTMNGKKPGQLERRLAKEGDLRVRMIEPSDVSTIDQCVRAMLAWKRQWGERTGKQGVWLFSSHYQTYLMATLTKPGGFPTGEPPARLIAVMLGDQPIAVSIMSHGNPLANAVIASFDPAYGKFGAGAVAWEHAVKWALEQHYDIDFGVGSERFKTYWGRGNRSYAWSMQIGNSAWGVIGHGIVRALRELYLWLKGGMPATRGATARAGEGPDGTATMENLGK
ncbi:MULTISPECIES: GNAT family N-acetyltransferase [unclassified Caballeronia]|uniref:GNAT family N-acetyltransferase n=1 Tax=unclassified Caballeronia TaxID=2646786 RepID=UPI00285962B9|nr:MULTISPECIES: GNAT family N-acetyltransferase [unclassified Caballeronia]MDR5816090.1 GNAT family N-acetyltransferase [Caballeronia sp. LZ033]MDR5880806.1 GNAT family N-acetyltransferase [Caballeronia sp. LZ032]